MLLSRVLVLSFIGCLVPIQGSQEGATSRKAEEGLFVFPSMGMGGVQQDRLSSEPPPDYPGGVTVAHLGESSDEKARVELPAPLIPTPLPLKRSYKQFRENLRRAAKSLDISRSRSRDFHEIEEKYWHILDNSVEYRQWKDMKESYVNKSNKEKQVFLHDIVKQEEEELQRRQARTKASAPRSERDYSISQTLNSADAIAVHTASAIGHPGVPAAGVRPPQSFQSFTIVTPKPTTTPRPWQHEHRLPLPYSEPPKVPSVKKAVMLNMPELKLSDVPEGYELIPLNQLTHEHEVVPWREAKEVLNVTVASLGEPKDMHKDGVKSYHHQGILPTPITPKKYPSAKSHLKKSSVKDLPRATPRPAAFSYSTTPPPNFAHIPVKTSSLPRRLPSHGHHFPVAFPHKHPKYIDHDPTEAHKEPDLPLLFYKDLSKLKSSSKLKFPNKPEKLQFSDLRHTTPQPHLKEQTRGLYSHIITTKSPKHEEIKSLGPHPHSKVKVSPTPHILPFKEHKSQERPIEFPGSIPHEMKTHFHDPLDLGIHTTAAPHRLSFPHHRPQKDYIPPKPSPDYSFHHHRVPLQAGHSQYASNHALKSHIKELKLPGTSFESGTNIQTNNGDDHHYHVLPIHQQPVDTHLKSTPAPHHVTLPWGDKHPPKEQHISHQPGHIPSLYSPSHFPAQGYPSTPVPHDRHKDFVKELKIPTPEPYPHHGYASQRPFYHTPVKGIHVLPDDYSISLRPSSETAYTGKSLPAQLGPQRAVKSLPERYHNRYLDPDFNHPKRSIKPFPGKKNAPNALQTPLVYDVNLQPSSKEPGNEEILEQSQTQSVHSDVANSFLKSLHHSTENSHKEANHAFIRELIERIVQEHGDIKTMKISIPPGNSSSLQAFHLPQALGGENQSGISTNATPGGDRGKGVDTTKPQPINSTTEQPLSTSTAGYSPEDLVFSASTPSTFIRAEKGHISHNKEINSTLKTDETLKHLTLSLRDLTSTIWRMNNTIMEAADEMMEHAAAAAAAATTSGQDNDGEKGSVAVKMIETLQEDITKLSEAVSRMQEHQEQKHTQADGKALTIAEVKNLLVDIMTEKEKLAPEGDTRKPRKVKETSSLPLSFPPRNAPATVSKPVRFPESNKRSDTEPGTFYAEPGTANSGLNLEEEQRNLKHDSADKSSQRTAASETEAEDVMYVYPSIQITEKEGYEPFYRYQLPQHIYEQTRQASLVAGTEVFDPFYESDEVVDDRR